MKRSELRELVFKAIFQSNFGNEPEEYIQNYLSEESTTLDENDAKYIDMVIAAYKQHQSKIDDYIKAALNEEWQIDRLSLVDLSILRLMITETVYIEDVHFKIAANEAIEIAKKYSDEKSPGFINAVFADFLKAENIK